MSEEDLERAKHQAKSQLESVVEMVKRLEHVRTCSGGEDCELTAEKIYAGINLYYSEADKLNNTKATEEEREQYHDEEDATRSISEDPLSVEVRSDWHNPGAEEDKPTEYTILLCTGGPACRIIGELDEYGQPDTAQIEYQDWFTPWIRYGDTSNEDDEALLTYARQFYFGR